MKTITSDTAATDESSALPALNDRALARLAAAWGVDPAECTAMWATAQDAVAAQAEEDAARENKERSERNAFHQWWKSLHERPCSIEALEAWLARAAIARECEIKEINRETEAAKKWASLCMSIGASEESTPSGALQRVAKNQSAGIVVSGDVVVDGSVKTENTPFLANSPYERLAADYQGIEFRSAAADLGIIIHDTDLAGTAAVLQEVGVERIRQLAKWGAQTWPLAPYRRSVQRLELCNSTRDENLSKELCEKAFASGNGTFAHILAEEFAEALDAKSPAEMRAELIQVAAVAVQMIEVIDRTGKDASDIAIDTGHPVPGHGCQEPKITKIEFSGPVGCGKTTLMQEIADALKGLGRPVVYTERDAQRSGLDHVALIVEKD